MHGKNCGAVPHPAADYKNPHKLEAVASINTPNKCRFSQE
jgi:hypothetical protein